MKLFIEENNNENQLNNNNSVVHVYEENEKITRKILTIK